MVVYANTAKPKAIREGVQVITPGGAGTVIYVRMLPPDFAVVGAVAVCLDVKKDAWGYCGTVYEAADVKPLVN